MNETNIIIKRALISVSDKKGLDALVTFLHQRKVEIISTGGTRKFIENLGIPVTSIESITGNPEAFSGRMKSISFQVASALLYRRGHQGDELEAKELNISPIDLVVCNLYPFEQSVKKEANEDILIENIDIGGPLMLRAAAKNYESVCTLSSFEDYDRFISSLTIEGVGVSFAIRRQLALKTFARIAQYDCMIAEELYARYNSSENSFLPWLSFESLEDLRYGENPHQWGKIARVRPSTKNAQVVQAEIIQGKELSYNNWLDTDSAWRIVSELKAKFPQKKAVAVIKHSNPCGLSVSSQLAQALFQAWEGDSVSSFGGVLAFSECFDEYCANFLVDKFIEVVIAPEFSESALKIMAKKKNVRLLRSALRQNDEKEVLIRSIAGGFLIQNEDDNPYSKEEMNIVTKKGFPEHFLPMVPFGVTACKFLKSNAIALVAQNNNDDFVLVGAGMGQPNRLDSLKLLAQKRVLDKGINLSEVLLISDAFFPFKDSIEVCHAVGIKAIVQPGGSIRDQEVIDCCDQNDIAMGFTAIRHFRH